MLEILLSAVTTGAPTGGNGNAFTEIGVGSIFVLMVLREIVPLLKSAMTKGNNGNGNGKEPEPKGMVIVPQDHVFKVDFDRLKEGVQYKDTCGQIVKRFESCFENQDKRFNCIESKLGTISTELVKVAATIDSRNGLFEDIQNSLKDIKDSMNNGH